MIPGRGPGEFRPAALLIAASATEAEGEILEKKVPFETGPTLALPPSIEELKNLFRFAAIACSLVGVSL